MNEENCFRVSVRDMIEYVLRNGDIVSGFTGTSRMTEAIRAHQYIQKNSGENYSAEVTVKHIVKNDNITLEVNGRIDGVINSDGEITIDEIKTVTCDMKYIDENYNILHFAQAKCYAFIYASDNEISDIKVQLTYFNLDTKEIVRFLKSYSLEELEEYFNDIAEKYMNVLLYMSHWIKDRNEKIEDTDFPFSVFRCGQRKMAVSVYKTIEEGKRIFIEAPTGIGKTAGAIFPAFKAMGRGYTSKIFYLTARNTGRSIAEGFINIMQNNGMKIRYIVLSAKEKICINDKVSCNPDDCIYAKGHFDRINAALSKISECERLNSDSIKDYAREFKVCPFELSLDLCNISDVIICDYNYAFDPRVYLKRFFTEEGGDYTFLIDEAHNMIDRSRDMYSSSLSKKNVLELRKELKNSAPLIYKSLGKINSEMNKLKKEIPEGKYYITKDKPKDFIKCVSDFSFCCEKWLAENFKNNFNEEIKEELLSAYFDALAFVNISELFNYNYIFYAEKNVDDYIYKLFCVNPSELLDAALKKARCAVFFSATLSPMNYYMYMLSGKDSYKMSIESPFPKENQCVIVQNKISTKYNDRNESMNDVVDSIGENIRAKKGNYLVFFPSYKYMQLVYEAFLYANEAIINSKELKVIIQKTQMNDAERSMFLDNFNEDRAHTLIGFVLMGGIFGEGIDLVGDKLCGAIIVGVGLPQMCSERDIISSYFSESLKKGFEFAYLYPGMNKVMQAAGRVIRTERDKGSVLLIDTRFDYDMYKKLFPKNWFPLKKASDSRQLKKILTNFWI